MPQNTTEWTPTLKQAALLEAAQEAGLNRSITLMCTAAGVDRTSFYRWLRNDPEFAAAWRSVWRDAIGRHLPGVVAAQLAKALDGDTSAARLVADLAGVTLTRQRIEAEVKQETTLTDHTASLESYLSVVAEISTRLSQETWTHALDAKPDVAVAIQEWLGAENLEALLEQTGADRTAALAGLITLLQAREEEKPVESEKNS